MNKPLRILIVEDSEDDALLTIRELKKCGYEPEYERVEAAEAMRTALREKSWDIILCDYTMPKFSGLAAIALLKEIGIDLPLIIVSGAIGEEMAVECMRIGAYDYIMKDNLSRLVPAIKRGLIESDSRIKRQQAEKALLKSEEKFRKEKIFSQLLLDTSPAFIVAIGFDGKTLMMNQSLLDALEYTTEEIKGVDYLTTFVPEEDRMKLVEVFQKIVRERKANINENRIISRSGRTYLVEWHGRPVIQKGGDIDIFVGVGIDITERKQAENALLRTNTLLDSIIENIPDMIFLKDAKDLRFVRFNRAGEELLGYSREDLLGMNDYDLFPKDQADFFTEKDRAVLSGKDVLDIPEEPLQTRNKGERTIHTKKVPILNAKGESEYLLGISEDITNRKRAEEALLSSEQRLSDIIEFLPDATLVIDNEGKVIAWNRAMEIMTGVKATDMLGKGDYEYALPFYGERRPILIDMALHQEPAKDKSHTHLQRVGDLLFGEAYAPGLIGGKTHLSATASLLRNAGGEVVAAIECIRDDTERRRTQENLQQAEERYRSIFENAQEGIYRSTPTGRIILANQAMANMFGYKTPEELMTDVADVARQFYVNSEEHTKLREIIEEQGSVINHETQLHRKDGSVFWVSITMQAVRDEKGQILYYEGIGEDITGRKEMAERMRKSLGATVQAIAVIVEIRDPYTAGHQRKVADLARAMATEMKLPADQIDGIRMASAIHDLGKISVPAEILSNPKKLTALEFSLIKTHAQSGYDILKGIEFPWPVARMIREHHERMDGTGYPQGLIGEEILLEARILAIADVVESMASHRPYRPALGLNTALAEIENNKGTLYDADAVDACLRLFRDKGFQLERT
ncbi:MAG: PAS domain S-box protein [Syntrophales bacterium]|jgi:PAS domain S-box-containing protein|nr:PAS domain S-box protein [Syntrophales bacterium]